MTIAFATCRIKRSKSVKNLYFCRKAAETMVYGNKMSVMADFFEEAYKTRCFLFVTSNLGAQEIEQRYGERVRDRFREMFHSMKFTNPSFR